MCPAPPSPRPARYYTTPPAPPFPDRTMCHPTTQHVRARTTSTTRNTLPAALPDELTPAAQQPVEARRDGLGALDLDGGLGLLFHNCGMASRGKSIPGSPPPSLTPRACGPSSQRAAGRRWTAALRSVSLSSCQEFIGIIVSQPATQFPAMKWAAWIIGIKTERRRLEPALSRPRHLGNLAPGTLAHSLACPSAQ